MRRLDPYDGPPGPLVLLVSNLSIFGGVDGRGAQHMVYPIAYPNPDSPANGGLPVNPGSGGWRPAHD